MRSCCLRPAHHGWLFSDLLSAIMWQFPLGTGKCSASFSLILLFFEIYPNSLLLKTADFRKNNPVQILRNLLRDSLSVCLSIYLPTYLFTFLSVFYRKTKVVRFCSQIHSSSRARGLFFPFLKIMVSQIKGWISVCRCSGCCRYPVPLQLF